MAIISYYFQNYYLRKAKCDIIRLGGKMDDLIDKYVNDFSNSEDFKKLKELKKLIDDKYKKEILLFKTALDKYQEALKYPDYYDMKKIRNDLSKAKSNLYSKEDVIEYLKLENSLQVTLDNDFNDIKKSISNKFTDKKHFSYCNKLNK